VCKYLWDPALNFLFLFFFLWVVLEFELSALCLLGNWILLNLYPEAGLSGSYCNSTFNFWGTPINEPPKGLHYFTFLPSVCKSSPSSSSLVIFCAFFSCAYSNTIFFGGTGAWTQGLTGAWTQGLTLARQILYHLSHFASPVLCCVFLRQGLRTVCLGLFQTAILPISTSWVRGTELQATGIWLKYNLFLFFW
jgi:hypothetical protein